MDYKELFAIGSHEAFGRKALEVFRHQYRANAVYRTFCRHLGKNDTLAQISEIPFLPIEFFKSRKVVSSPDSHKVIFTSSGTTGSTVSSHFVQDLRLYEESYVRGFEYFYGPISQYCVLALLPSYLERSGSSLVYMVNDLIKRSGHEQSGFYLNDMEGLKDTLIAMDASGTKVLLIGVSFGLLGLVEKFRFRLRHTIVMETGGMKGRRKEMVREELHETLKNGFGVDRIHSEYGMTELLSQAYSQENGIFSAPPWMKIQIRDTEDPLSPKPFGKTGGVNVIDLANINSCSFIATQDLGKVYEDGSFEILGRYDHSDIRGCNLMAL